MSSFFSDWKDITSPIAAERRVPNVSIAWRRPGKGRPLLEFLVNARLVTLLGWKDGICARFLVAPDGSALAFVPQDGGKVLRDRGGGLAVSHRPDWIAQDLAAHPAEIAPHRIEDGCLVITLPDWARDAAAAHPAAPLAETAKTAFPPAHFRPPVGPPSDDILAEEEREAEALIRADPAKWHGRALAEYFGWTKKDAAAFAARIRDAMAQEAAAARDAAE
jgi:hypothetical protein